jgi:hypothetical protein
MGAGAAAAPADRQACTSVFGNTGDSWATIGLSHPGYLDQQQLRSADPELSRRTTHN